MKITRTIAWTAMASLLVIGPLTMTRAHEIPTWPSPLNLPMLGTSVVSTDVGDFLNVDLRVSGLSGSALGQAIVTAPPDDDGRNTGFVVKRVPGLSGYLVITTPGSAYAALIQVDLQGGLHMVAHLYRGKDATGETRVIILVLDPERQNAVVTVAGAEDGMDAQSSLDAADAGAILFAAGMQL